MEEKKYLAALLDLTDGYWKLTDDYDKVIAAGAHEVIFVTNLRDLKVALQGLHTYDHPKVRREFHGWAIQGALSYTTVYTGNDADEFADILATNFKLNFEALGVEDPVLARHLNQHHLEYGLVRDEHFSRRYRYKPDVALKRAKQQAYNKRRQGITVYDVSTVVIALWGRNRDYIPIDRPGIAGWLTVVNGMRIQVATFNLLFGKNAHRRFKPFQDLLDKWKGVDDLSKKRIRKEYGFDKFAAWLDAECKARRRPALETWTPKKLAKPY